MSSTAATETASAPAVAAEPALTTAQLIEQLIKTSTELASQHKLVVRTLTTLQRQWEREQKRASRSTVKRTVVQKPVQVNKAMRDFMVKHAGAASSAEGFTRREMMKALSEYIKANKLAEATDKKKWAPDATLTKLLTLEKGKTFSYMNLNGLSTRIVVKPTA
jgi:chromatin remodeling complex protein RSC6